MESVQVGELYKAFRDDRNVDLLQADLNRPNLFSILGVQRKEIRHSNFLAWILNPSANHGFGSGFLVRMLRHISALASLSVQETMNLEAEALLGVEVYREWKNTDVLLVTKNAVICIENKIDAKDSKGQLTKYRNLIEKHYPKKKHKVFIYLTPFGEMPTDEQECEYYLPLSYQTIIDHVMAVSEIHRERLSERTKLYIDDYVSLIRRDIMNNDNVNELANVIYKNHKELLDFVFENRIDVADVIYPIIEARVRNSGWIPRSKNKGFTRFLTKELDAIIPAYGIGWPGKESFLFEINFYWQKGKIVFKTVIAPTTNASISELLSGAIEKIEVVRPKKPQGKKHIVHYSRSWEFDIDQVYGEDEVAPVLNKMWPEIEKIVSAVEDALKPLKEDLIKYRYGQTEQGQNAS